MKPNQKTTGFRRPAVVVGLLLFLASATVISALGVHFLYGQWQSAERGKRAADDNADLAFQHMVAVLRTALDDFGRDDRPISKEGLAIFFSAAEYFQDFADRNAAGEDHRAARAVSLHLLGRFNCAIGEVGRAEQDYRQAGKLFTELVDEQPRRELYFGLAENYNCLCYLLAELGQYDEARRVGLQSIELLQQMTEEFGDLVQLYYDKAVAANNLGMLALSDGRRDVALKYLRQNLSILQQIAKKLPQDITAAERLIDAQQIFSAILCRNGRLAEARRVYDASRDMVERLEKLHDKAETITLDFTTAKRMARCNRQAVLSALATGNTKPNKNNGSISAPKYLSRFNWNWRPLSRRDAKTIRPDFHVRGRLPAEFERHDAMLIGFSWEDSPGQKDLTIQLIAALVKHTQIVVLVPDTVARKLLLAELTNAQIPLAEIHFYQIPMDTPWIRDYGPLFIDSDGGPRLVDACYTGPRFRDDYLPTGLGRLLRMSNVRIPIRMPGGNLLTNGKGLCVATRQLLDDNVKRGFTHKQVTETVKRLCGAVEVIYLEPLLGEPTGHVDWFAAFTSPDTIVIGDYAGIDPANAAILNRNAQRLRAVKTPSGPLRVVRIPMPPRGGDYFGGTYTNVVFANGLLLIPTWPDADPMTEKQAFAVFRRLLPGWNVVGIDAGALRRREGAFRCMTMPLGRLPFKSDERRIKLD